MATESQFRGRLHASYSLKFKGEELKCSYAAFGEQNKIDNDCKCQQVYKSHIINLLNLIYFYVKLQPQH